MFDPNVFKGIETLAIIGVFAIIICLLVIVFGLGWLIYHFIF